MCSVRATWPRLPPPRPPTPMAATLSFEFGDCDEVMAGKPRAAEEAAVVVRKRRRFMLQVGEKRRGWEGENLAAGRAVATGSGGAAVPCVPEWMGACWADWSGWSCREFSSGVKTPRVASASRSDGSLRGAKVEKSNADGSSSASDEACLRIDSKAFKATGMDELARVIPTTIAPGLLNVWIVRSGKRTS